MRSVTVASQQAADQTFYYLIWLIKTLYLIEKRKYKRLRHFRAVAGYGYDLLVIPGIRSTMLWQTLSFQPKSQMAAMPGVSFFEGGVR
jgi:hypothetical protein